MVFLLESGTEKYDAYSHRVSFLIYCLQNFQESLLLFCNYVITKSYSWSK